MAFKWKSVKRRLISVILLVMTVFVFPSAASALERYEILMLGDKDEYVLEIQNALYAMGYLKQNPSGYFGTNTQNAVISLQKANNLTVDGKAGPETRKAILGDKFMEISLARSVSGTQGMNNIQIMPGDKGEEMKKCQERLKELEYYTYNKITGYFGPITALAVQRFQRTNGLDADGVLNTQTLELLFSGHAKIYTIYPGDKSDDVRKMQERLKELGYYEHDVTGYFGTVTKEALISFQKTNGLTSDGKAGKNTRKLLFADNAKKNTGETKKAKKVTENTATKVQKMLSIAKEQLGKKYVRGREGPDSFDCSGFVYYIVTKLGIHTTRFSADAFSKVSSWTKITKMDSLIPGDILFWKNSASSRIGHTGIYLGNGKFIHSSGSNKKVVYGKLMGYFERNFAFARRIF